MTNPIIKSITQTQHILKSTVTGKILDGKADLSVIRKIAAGRTDVTIELKVVTHYHIWVDGKDVFGSTDMGKVVTEATRLINLGGISSTAVNP